MQHYCFVIQQNTEAGKNLQMFIDPHHSESPIRFSHMRKNPTTTNEPLARENYLPNTISLMYA